MNPEICPFPLHPLRTLVFATVAKAGDTMEMLQHRYKDLYQAGATSVSTLSILIPLRDHSGLHNLYDTTVFYVTTLAHLPPPVTDNISFAARPSILISIGCSLASTDAQEESHPTQFHGVCIHRYHSYWKKKLAAERVGSTTPGKMNISLTAHTRS